MFLTGDSLDVFSEEKNIKSGGRGNKRRETREKKAKEFIS